ncbi:MAG: FUSC family protein [Bacteroidota bacterium]
MQNFIRKYTSKFRKGRYLHGIEGTLGMLASFFTTLQFANTNEALISALTALFLFIEHRGFSFKRRIAQSLGIVGIQIIVLVIIAVFFNEYYILAIPFNFILFFSLNYYNYFETPNAIALLPIQFLYLISLTTPVAIEDVVYRILAILVGIIFTAIGLLLLWPTKTHKTIEKSISSYLGYTRQILESNITDYKESSSFFKEEQNQRFAAIMDSLYGLKYGNVFSTTKGKFLFKLAINTQILNDSLHKLKKSPDLDLYKNNDGVFCDLTERWRIKFIELIKLLEDAVLEDKHSLLYLEEKYSEFDELTKLITDWAKENKSDKLRLRFNEIYYLTNTLLDFSKRLVLYRHKSEAISENKFDVLFRFDNLKHNLLKSLSFKQPSVRFAFHISLMLTVSLFLVAYFDIFEGFWVPMTILLILKPNHGGTKKQTLKRIGGTIVGLIISFILINYTPSDINVPAIIFAVFMSVSLIKVEYGLAVVFITMAVVLFMVFDYDSNEIFVTRLTLTIGTAAIVFISNYFVLPNWSKFEIRDKMIEALNNDLTALRSILDKADSMSINKDEVRLSLLNSYQSRRQINELYTIMKAEPKSQRLNATVGKQFLVAHERFGQNYSRFIYTVLTKKANLKLPYNYIKSTYVSSIKNIISNLTTRNNRSEKTHDSLHKLYAFFIDFELTQSLSDEQKLMVDDLKKTTKRLMELNNLSENEALIFVS